MQLRTNTSSPCELGSSLIPKGQALSHFYQYTEDVFAIYAIVELNHRPSKPKFEALPAELIANLQRRAPSIASQTFNLQNTTRLLLSLTRYFAVFLDHVFAMTNHTEHCSYVTARTPPYPLTLVNQFFG